MFVPSLSCQNDRFYIKMAQKCRFSQGSQASKLKKKDQPKPVRPFAMPFIYKNDHFTKTGSGHT